MPPVAVTLALPLLDAHEEGAVVTLGVKAGISERNMVLFVVQPLASFTVTVCAPQFNPVAKEVVAPEGFQL